jgi:type II secretory pathway component PulM
MTDWFASLQPREKLILAVGVVAAVVIVLFGGVQKLGTSSSTLMTSVESKQRLLVDLSRLDSAAGTPVSTREGADQTLVVIISDTAATHGLTFPRTRPNGPNGIDVTFQQASFDALVAWLVALHDNYGIEVDSASFSAGRSEGLVNGQLSLQRL